ncbi:MAG TPA: aminotransferase class IV [Stellaceae bacterium]|nr:aminotransferase class IV [Stellaceae bacterium]
MPTTLANQRIAFFNGKYVPEREVVIPFRDRSFTRGDGAFDMTRSFNGRIFKIKEHIDRFYRSLKYVAIDPGMNPKEMIEVSEEVLARNRHLLGKDEDYWIAQRVSRGVEAVGDEGWDHVDANVIVDCVPLPFKKRAKLYRDGMHVVVPPTRRVAPSMLSPRAKMHQYMNLVIADMEAKVGDPDAVAVLLDENGNLAEGAGANIFVVRDGEIWTPHSRYVLPGISRATAIELAAKLGIPAQEKDLDVFDAVTADEIFITSTSYCICPVARFNGRTIGDGKVPGPITARLTKAYVELVDCDFVRQYTRHLD